MGHWIRFFLTLILILIISIIFRLRNLPLNILFVLGLILLDQINNRKRVLIAVLFLTVFLDIYSGLAIGVSGLFLIVYTQIFEILENNYLNFIKRIKVFIKISLGIVLYYFYIAGWRKLGGIIGFYPEYFMKIDLNLVLSLFISMVFGLIVAFLGKQVVKLILGRAVER